jgi:hypothetical protein
VALDPGSRLRSRYGHDRKRNDFRRKTNPRRREDMRHERRLQSTGETTPGGHRGRPTDDLAERAPTGSPREHHGVAVCLEGTDSCTSTRSGDSGNSVRRCRNGRVVETPRRQLRTNCALPRVSRAAACSHLPRDGGEVHTVPVRRRTDHTVGVRADGCVGGRCGWATTHPGPGRPNHLLTKACTRFSKR